MDRGLPGGLSDRPDAVLGGEDRPRTAGRTPTALRRRHPGQAAALALSLRHPDRLPADCGPSGLGHCLRPVPPTLVLGLAVGLPHRSIDLEDSVIEPRLARYGQHARPSRISCTRSLPPTHVHHARPRRSPMVDTIRCVSITERTSPMASHNSVTLMGNLTRDPELRHTPNGMSVASFGLAINRQTRGGEEVTFVDITVWDKQAETAAQFLKKGRLVLIEGRLRQEKWEDKNGGGTRSKLVIVAERVTFLPSGNGNGNGNGASAEMAGAVAGADEEVPF